MQSMCCTGLLHLGKPSKVTIFKLLYMSIPVCWKNKKLTKGVYILKIYLLISELKNVSYAGTPYLSNSTWFVSKT